MNQAYRAGQSACADYYASDPLRDDSDRDRWPRNPYDGQQARDWRRGWNGYIHPAWKKQWEAA